MSITAYHVGYARARSFNRGAGASPAPKMVKSVRLGSQGLVVPRIGYGAMGLSWLYSPGAHVDADAVFAKLQELGVTFLDTAAIYASPGLPHNEEVIGGAIKKWG